LEILFSVNLLVCTSFGNRKDNLIMSSPTTPLQLQVPLQSELREDPEELFEIVEELGRGSYGNVYQATHLPTGKEVALKVLRLDAMTDIKELKAEISLLSKIKSSYIVQYYGSYIKNRNLWISMEYCDAGSALDVITQLKKPFTELQIASLMHQTLFGLYYLHTMSPPTVHRDIKAGNILLNSKGEVKLADFGIATQLTDTLKKRQTQIGSPFWMAPEIIQESPYDTKVDIWSLGITAIELAQLKPPHWESGSIRALFLIATKPSPTLDDPSKWSKEFKGFVEKCVNKNPKERPSAKELMEHSFVNRANGHEVLAALVDECFLFEESSEKSDRTDDGTDFNSVRSFDQFGSLPIATMDTRIPFPGNKDAIAKFKFRGECREGSPLVVEGVKKLPEEQKNCRFLWFRSPSLDEEFIPIESSSSCYIPTKEDLNCLLKCVVVVGGDNGDPISPSGEATFTVITDQPIQPGWPEIKRITIEGGPYYTRIFEVKTDYFGGEEGHSIIEWYRSYVDGRFEQIEGVKKRTYQPIPKEIGVRLEVKYTPVRRDGVQGVPIFAVSKPVLKVNGRVLLYGISGIPACLHAKHLLLQKSVPFVEIDLLRFPKRLTEMEKLTGGKKTVPQIFFNKDHIGGLRELLSLEASGKLSGMLKEVINAEPPEFPQIPSEEENEKPLIKPRTATVSSKEDAFKLFEIYLKLRDPKLGLKVKVRGPITRRVKAFKGQELLKWLKLALKLPDNECIILSQQLLDYRYFYKLKETHSPFAADSTLYRFYADIYDGFMLNMDQCYHMEKEGKKKRSPYTIAQDLLRQILLIVEKYAKYKGEGIDFSHVIASGQEYAEFVATTQELQKAEITGMKDEEFKAFFLNIYNTLAYHSNIVVSLGIVKLPTVLDKSERQVVDSWAWGRFGYIINDYRFSLVDIQHGILRENRKVAKQKLNMFSKHDPRANFMTKFDPRIHFALVSSVKAFPAIVVFSRKSVDSELKLVTEGYLEDQITVDKSSKELLLPRVFQYYGKDFGKNENGLIKWIAENLSPGTKKEDLENMIQNKVSIKIKFSKQDLELSSTCLTESINGMETETLADASDTVIE